MTSNQDMSNVRWRRFSRSFGSRDALSACRKVSQVLRQQCTRTFCLTFGEYAAPGPSWSCCGLAA
eukprot:3353378-Amphidinium_carterae.1